MSEAAKRIITIDDENAVRRSLKAYLEDSGFTVLEADNGQTGIELIKSSSPDLVLCDLRMPVVDGLDVVAFVSQNMPELPIIIVSGTGVIGDAVEAVRLGAWDYVLKPVEDMAALEHIIMRALDRARLIRENKNYKQHLVDEVHRQTAEIRDQAEQLERTNNALRREIEERERTERVLNESEQRYRDLVENLQEGLGTVDRDEVFQFCNSAMAAIFELAPQELIGRSLYEFLPDSEKEHVRAQTNDRSLGRSSTYTLEITSASGNKKFAIVRARPMYDETGEYVGASALIQDVTEQKKLEHHLRQTQKMETIGTLAGGIAHDFNNILTPILGYAEMALSDWGDGASQKESIRQISTAAMRARDLVKQILVFSRQTESEKKPTEVHLIVREVIKLLQSTLPASIEIIEDVDRHSGRVLADPTQIHQVVMNLCTNAFHAMEEKGGELEIGLSRFDVDLDMAQQCPSLRIGPYLRLSVTDTGCGIPKEIQEKVFEPFFTTKEVGKGTGLGLSLVHGIVAEHAGHVALYSEQGVGTTIHVYFPLLEDGNCKADTTSETARGGSERILLVDDEVQIAEMAEKMLTRLGYSVTAFSSSETALDTFKSDPSSYDLLITDINMPKLTGLGLIELVRNLRADLPVVIISGFSDRITQGKFQGLDNHRFVMKPIVMKELDSAIREVIAAQKEPSNTSV